MQIYVMKRKRGWSGQTRDMYLFGFLVYLFY